MTVRIGKIELNSVHEFHIKEVRTLVQQRVPEQQGSVYQDLGREPVTLILEGEFFTEDALSKLETLREAHLKAKPMSLAADAIAGTQITDIIIEELTVRQLAGYQHRFRYTLRLLEYKKPPQAANADIKPVDKAVAKDADTFGKDSLAAAKVLKDPASMPTALEKNPGLLNHIKPDELAASITKKSDSITASTFSNILKAIKKIDPAKVVELVLAMRDAGSFGKFMEKYLDEGLDFLSDLSGCDLTHLGPFIKAFMGGAQFLQDIGKIVKSVEKLGRDLSEFDLLATVRPVLEGKK
jgi:hypothetical protein